MVDYLKYILDLLINLEKDRPKESEIRPTLEIDEPMPIYETDKPKKKKESSVIIIDI